jgi:hypothetical protein
MRRERHFAKAGERDVLSTQPQSVAVDKGVMRNLTCLFLVLVAGCSTKANPNACEAASDPPVSA